MGMSDGFEQWQEQLAREIAGARTEMVQVVHRLLDDGVAPVAVSLACDAARRTALGELGTDRLRTVGEADWHTFLDIHAVSVQFGRMPIKDIETWLTDPPEWIRKNPFPTPVRGTSPDDWLWIWADINAWGEGLSRRGGTDVPENP